jgi:tetratricopeptide (TPR) repeat protein
MHFSSSPQRLNRPVTAPSGRSALLLTTLLVTACATGPGSNSSTTDLAAPVQARVSLPAGSVLTLKPASIGKGKPRPTTTFLDALWRTALRQSPHFDCAAGIESCESPRQIELSYQPATQSFTTTLTQKQRAPIPLAAVQGMEIGPGIDLLAWQTRAALGEKVSRKPLPPVPCTLAYSADKDCIRFTELGLQELVAGRSMPAIRLFQQARRHDAASPVTLLHLAASLANRMDSPSQRQAQKTAVEALEYQSRLTLGTQHRLARILLLTSRDDAKLMALGVQYRLDRPHDPHGQFTIAHGLCRLGRYREALSLLTDLQSRWPRNAPVRYQLAFAMLATGNADGALTALEEARRGLSQAAVARPFAMALFHSNQHDELQRFLKDLRRRPGIKGNAPEREVMRMQASHALLTNQPAEAARYIAESFSWIRQTNTQLSRFTLDVVEDGEVLARLGQRQILADGIAGFLQLGQLPPAFANAITYLGGLLAVLDQKPTKRALATLQKSHDTVLHGQLQAAVFRHAGQLKAETAALRRVLASSSDTLSYASYARALSDAGEQEMATKTTDYIRRRLLAFNQRAPYDHPLMTPGRAMAYLSIRR